MSDVTTTDVETTDVEMIELIEKAIGDVERLTPYRMATVLSGLVGKTIRPQMMYNYKNKKFGFRSYRNTEGHFVVDHDDVVEFFVRFLTRQASKSE